jgi:hypothetical protein
MKILGADLDFYRRQRKAKKQGHLATLLARAKSGAGERKETKSYAGIRHEDERLYRFLPDLKREKRRKRLAERSVRLCRAFDRRPRDLKSKGRREK